MQSFYLVTTTIYPWLNDKNGRKQSPFRINLAMIRFWIMWLLLLLNNIKWHIIAKFSSSFLSLSTSISWTISWQMKTRLEAKKICISRRMVQIAHTELARNKKYKVLSRKEATKETLLTTRKREGKLLEYKVRKEGLENLTRTEYIKSKESQENGE